MELDRTVKGRCHCGAIAFEVSGGIGVINCHCEDCQRMHGNYNPLLAGPASNVSLVSDETLTWYDSSEEAQRGFCNRCGSRLFKRSGDRIMVSMGSLEDTGLKTMKNIWVESKGSWYELPQVEES